MSTYAPTLVQSERNPEIRQEYYESLQSAIKEISNRKILIIGGDMNAKTGTGKEFYPDAMGHHGKGEMNSSGEMLLQMATINDLILTNTFFKHKMSHRTTWECPERINEHRDRHGNIRKNPYRNQIDYIITRKILRRSITNSRSYSGLETKTDHRLVRTDFKISWEKMYRKKEERKINMDLEKLNDKEIQKEYCKEVEKYMKNKENTESIQGKWDKIVNACKTAGEQTLGRKKSCRKSENPEIKRLSEMQKKLRDDINACKDKNKRQEKKRERNNILKEIKEKLRIEETVQIEKKIEDLEKHKNDSTKMFKAIKALKISEPKKEIIVDSENGMVTDENTQCAIITDFFRNMFFKENEDPFPDIKPQEMKTPFTPEEVGKAIKSLKNNKSPGSDQLKSELLKFGPNIIHQEIAEILNEIAKTGTYPQEVKNGLLIPLPKPGKRQGPPGNLRPIILLSILRKILAICMIKRTSKKFQEKIPVTQAAYKEGRSTTEMVFSFKILAEKAITSKQYQANLLLLDMSKAFDTVKRPTLLSDLKDFIDEDELHMIKIMLEDVQLQVKVKNSIGQPFKTNIGVPQGDCLSPILFTLYLAQALKSDKTKIEKDELLPHHLKDHSYAIPREDHFLINQQYADDISYISNASHIIEIYKEKIPEQLQDRNLNVNKEKTEYYEIRRNGSEEWKKCKYLGSLLDTDEDIKRRKGLAVQAANKLKYILDSKKLGTEIKIRTLNAYIASIFLYNSETWTVKKSNENEIDIFQRKFLRRILNIRWPEKISNNDLYERTKQERWSREIKRRRLSWLGHVLRMSEETPAKLALREAQRKIKKQMGNKLTWLGLIARDTRELNMNMNELEETANNRQAWSGLVRRAMSYDEER